MRVGIGYDVHKLVQGRRLVIGGIEINHSMGLLGHSDADVLLHAIMDSILGALGLGDIGKHFPDTDAEFKDISSVELLKDVARKTKEMGYRLNNMDAIIIAQAPKMAPYIEDMKTIIADVLEVEKETINIKATTTETLGFEGRREGISAQAVCTLVALGRDVIE